MIVLCDQEYVSRARRDHPNLSFEPFSDSADRAYQNARQISPGDEYCLLYRSVEPDQENLPVRDHINLTTENPLFGNQDDPRFPDMSRVYDFQGENACVITQGDTGILSGWPEQTVPVAAGIWDAIALKHRGASLSAWVVGKPENISAILGQHT